MERHTHCISLFFFFNVHTEIVQVLQPWLCALYVCLYKSLCINIYTVRMCIHTQTHPWCQILCMKSSACTCPLWKRRMKKRMNLGKNQFRKNMSDIPQIKVQEIKRWDLPEWNCLNSQDLSNRVSEVLRNKYRWEFQKRWLLGLGLCCLSHDEATLTFHWNAFCLY